MKINSLGTSTLVLFFAITVLGFIIWGALLLILWNTAAGLAPDFWAMTEALSTALAAAAVFSAGFIAYRELSEVASSRHMEVADRLFEELNSPENIAARRWIFQNLPGEPEQGLQSIGAEDRAAVKQVLNLLDHVAFLTQAGWIPEEIIMPWMHPMIAKAWEKLGPYVAYERERRKEPYYYQKVGDLAASCLAWRAKHLPEVETVWVEDAL